MPARTRRNNRPMGLGGKIVATLVLGVFLAFGLFFGAVILKDLGRAIGTYRWTETPCRIVSSAVQDSEQRETANPYVVAVQFEYEFGGATHRSGRYQLKPARFSDYAKAQWLADQYPAGSTTACYVNPSNPSEAVLKRGSLWLGVALLLPLLFVGLGGAFLIAVWKTGAEESTARPLTERARPDSAKKAGCFLIPFFGLFLVAGLVVFYWAFLRPVLRIQAAKSWPEVPCIIESSSVKTSRSDDSTIYRAEILYRYEFNGREYKSNRYHFVSQARTGRSRARRVVAAHKAGTRAVCYVNPRDPTEAVLQREFVPSLWLGLIPLVFVAVGVGGVTFGLRKARQPLLGARLIRRGAPHPGAIPTTAGDEPATLRASATPFGKFLATLIFALFWNGIVSVFVVQAVRGWQKDGGFMLKWFLPIFLIPFVLIGLVMIGAAFHSFLGLFNPRPTLNVSSRTVPLGGSFNLDWHVPGHARRLERLKIELIGREEATYQRGTRSHTDRHTFLTIPIADASSRLEIQKGQTQVRIPATTMHSFRAARNAVTWTLKLKGTIRRWPDVDEEYAIEVTPLK